MNTEETNDTGYDEIVVSIGLEWLVQYARFLRRSPELVAGLAERSGDFELIPIPKMLLERLALPGLMESGNLGDVDPEIRRAFESDVATFSKKASAHSREAALDCVRALAAAIDAGNADAAGALFSAQFINPDGRTSSDVRAALGQLFECTSDRCFRVLDIKEAYGSDTEIVARMRAMWTASATKGTAADVLTETLTLDVIVNRELEGVWKISSLRSL